MGIYDTQITISTGSKDSFVDFYKRVIPFKEMANIVHMPLKYSAATFKDNRRRASNYEKRADIIILDFDEGFPDKYYEIFDRYVGIIAPTKSHMKDKKGIICPRYRVILLLDKPMITTFSQHKRIYRHIIADLNVVADPSCVDASRFYYGSEDNKHLTRFLKGTELFSWQKYDYDDLQYVSFTKPKMIDIEPYKHIDISYIDDLNQSKRYECPICAMEGADKNKHHLGFEKDKHIVTCFFDEEHSQILRRLYYLKYNTLEEEENALGKERCKPEHIPVVRRYPKPTNYAEDTHARYDAALDILEKSPIIFLDTETFSEYAVEITLEEAQAMLGQYSYVKTAYNAVVDKYSDVALDPLRNQIRLIQLGDGNLICPFDVYYATPQQLWRILNIIKKSFVVGQFLKFDLRTIMCKYGEEYVPQYCFDTAVAAQLLHQAQDYEKDPLGYNLGAIAYRYCNIQMQKDEGASDWGRDNLTANQIRYSIDDVRVLPQIYAKMVNEEFPRVYGQFNWKEHDKTQMEFLGPLLDLHPIVAIEMQFVLELARIEHYGIKPNRAFLQRMLSYNMQRVEDNAKYLGINVNSPKQCVKFLQERVDPLITSSNKEVLEAYKENPIVEKIMEGKSLSTRSGLIRAMLDTHPYDNRLHASFKQILSTGRLSCKQPNMQQIPRNIKDFIYEADEGETIFDADYPAIELRINAVLQMDPTMLEAYANDIDLHYLTASKVFSKAIPTTKEEKELAEHGGPFIHKEERGKGKQTNFALQYGMIEKTLKEYFKNNGVIITIEEAKLFRDTFMQTYPNVAKAINNAFSTFYQGHEMDKKILTREGSFNKKVPYYTQVQTILGRKTTIDSPTTMLNYPVQGTGADIQKLGICKIGYDSRRLGIPLKIINLVHDDAVASAPNEYLEQAKKIFLDGLGFAANYVLKYIFFTDISKEYQELSKDGKQLKEYEW